MRSWSIIIKYQSVIHKAIKIPKGRNDVVNYPDEFCGKHNSHFLNYNFWWLRNIFNLGLPFVQAHLIAAKYYSEWSDIR